MDQQQANLNEAWRTAFKDLYLRLQADIKMNGDTTPLTDFDEGTLRQLHWDLNVMSGLLEAELVRRDGTTDMASS